MFITVSVVSDINSDFQVLVCAADTCFDVAFNYSYNIKKISHHGKITSRYVVVLPTNNISLH